MSLIHFHDHDAAEPEREEAPSGEEAWQPDDVLLMTVGIDIGSTTSHLMFAKLRMQRLPHYSSRFVPVERGVLHRSPIALTPYRADSSIDAAALHAFIEREYANAGLTHDDVDTGAVILTGSALESRNAAEIGEVFSREGGKFVCATAGHRLEAILAAHGSGAVARSRREGSVLLNVDVGGSTSKLALIDRGEIVATSALAAGARLVTLDERGCAVRVEHAATLYADRAGVRIGGPAPIPRHKRWRLASAMAEAIALAAHGHALGGELSAAQLLAPLPAAPRPSVVTLSGGVGEIVRGGAAGEFGDLGAELAACLAEVALPAPLAEPEEAIRATVVGASQFSVHLSGSTIFVSDERLLPLRNVPVVVAGTATDPASADDVERAVRDAVARSGRADELVVVAIPFRGEPRYPAIRALAEGLARAIDRRGTLVAAVTGDVAHSIGRILVDEIDADRGLVVMDDVELGDLDYVDIGAVMRPPGVVPVVVKTLVVGQR